MAIEGEEVEEYESDPDDTIVPSAMRRREASDDEEDGGGGVRTRDRAAAIGSDGESDGQGAAPAYEDEDVQEDDDEEYEEDIEEEEIIDEEIEVEEVEEEEEVKRGDEGDEKGVECSRRKEVDEDGEKKEEDEEEEKKENEPYAVPTAGAFYMHDDRFQENGRGRHRRMPGGQRLWESKDNRAWLHDRFEEMNLHDSSNDQGRRNSRGRFRGRGGGRTRGGGAVRSHAKGNNRSRGYYNEGNFHNFDGNNHNREGNDLNRPQKTVRGRGPRRYEPLPRNIEVSAPQHKQPIKSQESTSNSSSERSTLQTPNVQTDSFLTRKHVFASSLNSASPPFYPSGSSKQDTSITHKRDAQTGNITKTVSSSMRMENNFLSSQSSSMLRGKAIVDSVNRDSIYIDDSLRSVAGKALANAQVRSSGSPLTSADAIPSSQSRAQGRSLNITMQPSYQQTASFSQVPRVHVQDQPPVQQRPQTQFQHALRVSTQQVGQQRPASGNRVSSPPRVPSTNISEVGEMDSPPGSSKSKTQLIAKGKTGSQGAGRGSFLYSGAQVIGASGAMGLSQNDQNFSATPALLPVMQFGGQHHGGLGVPAVGMALPGYVAQPQLGFGNSEMTWVPILAGAAGALGASYPYIALDGSHYPRPSGQTSSSVNSNREAPKSANTLNPAQRPEIVNDEFGQRQNKPRRYSEMNFGQ